MSLDFSADAVLVKGAFGHSWKDINHWVHSVFLIGFEESKYVNAKGQEGAVEETVHQKHLTCDNVLVALQFFAISICLSLKTISATYDIYRVS